ncbi:hypothetical protein KG112_10985 [Nocardioides sp. zg-ZUI104]|uniref:LamG-like jellyroll fold domain-containing protein n=1 Tax=Nocardioides faecalis TaxID=2803858 RepID=UPI001BD169F3|nr:LamG-like jellyroll fold domain-containing protein [Nocardioides faecalis]MBS4753326.1 hypothetical protein [Nocardioides faecalis]
MVCVLALTASAPAATYCALTATPFGWLGAVAGGGQLFWFDGTVPTNNPVVTNNAWRHIAVVVAVRPGEKRKRFGLYIDGVRTTPTATPVEVTSSSWSKNIEILGLASTGFDDASALVDDVRISFAPGNYATEAGTKARYTEASFTVPTAPRLGRHHYRVGPPRLRRPGPRRRVVPPAPPRR